MAKCSFHEERNASCSFNFEKGVWRCHTCNIGGGMVDFEMKLMVVDHGTAYTTVQEIIGNPQSGMTFTGKPDTIYRYEDESGKLLFEVTRRIVDGKKKIANRKPREGGGWEYQLGTVRRVPYRLTELIRARVVFVVEGEKCADAARDAFCLYHEDGDACVSQGVAFTTNPHGAGKWDESYSPYFAGKGVFVIPDNDDPGRKHMTLVASSLSRFAAKVKWIDLPDVQEKDDIADYLEGHTWGDVEGLAQSSQTWKPAEATGFFVAAREMMKHVDVNVAWRVDGVIEKGTSGFIIALPKSGKSVATVTLAVALACGQPWLDRTIDGPTRTALISREDSPGLTGRRLRRAMQGMGLDHTDPFWDDYLFVNTRAQTSSLMLDNQEDVTALIEVMAAKRVEFAIFDVFNRMHQVDENDGTEMRKLLNRFEEIRKAVGCDICIVHHSTKDADEGKTLSQLVRGSSAIAGFAEWIVGVRLADEGEQIRQMRFETKSSEPLAPFYWKIRDMPIVGGFKLEQVDWEPPTPRRLKKGAA